MAFGGDGTRRQRGWDSKDGVQERRRGEKAADAAIGTLTRRRPRTAQRLHTGQVFGPGVAGQAREERRAVGVGQRGGAAYRTEATMTSGRHGRNNGEAAEASDRAVGGA
jgi:hypothetical protein